MGNSKLKRLIQIVQSSPSVTRQLNAIEQLGKINGEDTREALDFLEGIYVETEEKTKLSGYTQVTSDRRAYSHSVTVRYLHAPRNLGNELFRTYIQNDLDQDVNYREVNLNRANRIILEAMRNLNGK
jgi:hypothetical protein